MCTCILLHITFELTDSFVRFCVITVVTMRTTASFWPDDRIGIFVRNITSHIMGK